MSFNIEYGTPVPNVTFPARVDGDWTTLSTGELFAGKKVVLFGLPGAFTPTCSNNQVPGFDKLADQFFDKGIDAIYCLSVNDTFTMNAWFKELQVENLIALPDGNAEFSSLFGSLVNKENLGFGARSWRYAVVIEDGKVIQSFIEEGFEDNCGTDPYEVSTPENVLANIR